MVEISISHLYKSYGAVQVLTDLSMEVFTGERVAVVGHNGAGKTTLFRVLTGEEPYDDGAAFVSPSRRVGVLAQLPDYPPGHTAGDVLRAAFAPLYALRDEMARLEEAMKADPAPALVARYGALSHEFEVRGGFDMDTPLRRVRAGLQIDDELFSRPFDNLSGGEKTRVNLARLILTDTDILLLDEPTNHLDMKATEWLEDYLTRFKGTVLAVSHDRYFLDRVATRVIELEGGRARSYSGNYSFFAAEKAARLKTQREQYEREQREKARLTAVARRMHDYAGKNAKMHRRAFSIEKRAARAETVERPPSEQRPAHIRFGEKDFRAADVLRLHELEKAYDKPLFAGVTLTVRGGERIGLLGDNGTGKTTLMRVLAGEVPAGGGDLWRGPSVKTAYLPQHVEFSHPERTLLDTLLYEQGEQPQAARDRLGRFYFRGDDVFKRVGDLSGGEKSRLQLCMLMKGQVNLLLLDEPTNHLDIRSREWMEEAVEAFGETLIFISHDRYFIRRFATRLWVLENGRIEDFPGTWEEYRARAALPAPPVTSAEPPKKPPHPPSAPPRRGREQRVREARRRGLESEIEQRETLLDALAREMEEKSTDAASLTDLLARQDSINRERDELYAEWLALEAQE